MILLDSQYAHLKLRIVNTTYKYVLFDTQESFLNAINKISDARTNLPYALFFTQNERSAIIPSDLSVGSVKEKDVGPWACFYIVGEMPFGTVEGLIATISTTLKKQKIGICAVSSYKTDLFFVRSNNLDGASNALIKEGWQFI